MQLHAPIHDKELYKDKRRGRRFNYQIESQLEEEEEEGQMKEAGGYFELKSGSVGEEENLAPCLMLRM